MYSPRIRPSLIAKLYTFRKTQANKKPLTFYVNTALEEYLSRQEDKLDKNEKPTEKDDR